jgi:hypothetical protein
MNALPFRLAALGVCAVLLISAYSRPSSASVITAAANAFLASLTAEQRAKATFEFKDEERFDWHFIPRPRKGLPLLEMTPTQKHLAHALLSAGLSQTGYIKAATIMSLEDVLRILENDDGQRRNPEGYFFSVFGVPSDKGVWGYRVEGHHLSQNFTLAGGKVVGAPSFFGANPAMVKQGPRAGLRALAREEDLARELMLALDEKQRQAALVDKVAYKDILTAASRKASLEGQPSGLLSSRLNEKQLGLLLHLLEEYAGNLPGEMAQARLDRVRKAQKNLHFAWAGVLEKGGPHYYRVQGPDFLIEYDNTQNEANHIHAVWRDVTGDFGLDLLAEHYRANPHR